LVLFVDNDIALKLAAWDLWSSLQSAFEPSSVDIGVLATLPHITRKNRAVRDRFGDEAVQRVEQLAANASASKRLFFVDQSRVSTAVFSRLLAIEALDVGEALLFSAACAHDGSCRVITGDKRCVRALHQSGDPVAHTLSGQIICLEQVIRRFVSSALYEQVRQSIVRGPDVDRTISTVVFNQGLNTPRPTAIEALDSYIRELRSQTGTLLSSSV